MNTARLHAQAAMARRTPRATWAIRARRQSLAAFTLLEMLVVVAVMILVAIITIPAFTAMIASSERVRAEENLKRGMTMGHSLALRSGIGRDVAMVFFYEPPGPLTIVACQKVGELDSLGLGALFGQGNRDVFVPMGGVEPITMPPNWVVRGYALPGMIDGEWYEPATDGGNSRYPFAEAAWVFPETGFYDPNLSNPGRDGFNRQTFMVRFEAGTGRMTMSETRAALIVSPRPSSENRGFGNDLRADIAPDLEKWVHRVLATTDFDGDPRFTAADLAGRYALLGDGCGDTVLAKAVSQIALHDERALAADLGENVDRQTRCLYRMVNWDPSTPATDPHRPQYPAFIQGNRVTAERISRWIEGDTNGNRVPFDGNDQPKAQVFTVDRFSGQARPIALQPSSVGINP